MSDAEATRDITVEAVLPHAPDVVWKVLTTSDLIGQWLMPNDFAPVIGQRFHFKTRPMGNWDGTVDCEVREIVENRRLVYSWRGGSDDNLKYGARLDTTVTWTLVPVAGGTLLRMVHAGFRLPANHAALDAMSPGWQRVPQSIARIAMAQETVARTAD
jgi:uncharacterized protein YndB with AHSA1/START domain